MVKYCLRGNKDITDNNKAYYYHDVLKQFPKFCEEYHKAIAEGKDDEQAKEIIKVGLDALTNKCTQILVERNESDVVSKIVNFHNSLTWFEYKGSVPQTKEDKIMNFIASWKATQ